MSDNDNDNNNNNKPIIPIKELQDGTSLDAQERVCTVTYPNNIPIPNGHLRLQMRLHNLWHRATYIVITYNTGDDDTNQDNTKIIVQKRSQLKDFGPGLLDPSPGGIVGYNESYDDNAMRELQEEMGITITTTTNNNNNTSLTKILNFNYQDDNVKVFGQLYECKLSSSYYNDDNDNDDNVIISKLNLQKEEVEKVFCMTINEIQQHIKENSQDFMPDSLYAIQLYFEYINNNNNKREKEKQVEMNE